MPVKISCYGGRLGWIAHKHFSKQVMPVWLFLTEKMRRRKTCLYVNDFVKRKEAPVFRMVEIETVNRCNGRCSFCPASVQSETRPYKKMEDGLFYKIVEELKYINFTGEVLLEVNNEPLIDKRLSRFSEYIKKNIPDCKVAIITNGTLLTTEKLEQLAKSMDRILINHYSESYKLSPGFQEIYKYVKKYPEKFKNTEIEIRRRYVKEVLTNRAGTAPNKKKTESKVTIPCLYPFVGITIFPDGTVGLCSNDCLEKTEYGNLQKESLLEIWNGSKIKEARKRIASGRKNYAFCKNCDVIGIGTREKIAEENRK